MFAISNWDKFITVGLIGYVCNNQLGLTYITVIIIVYVCNKQLGQTYKCGCSRLCVQ